MAPSRSPGESFCPGLGCSVAFRSLPVKLALWREGYEQIHGSPYDSPRLVKIPLTMDTDPHPMGYTYMAWYRDPAYDQLS